MGIDRSFLAQSSSLHELIAGFREAADIRYPRRRIARRMFSRLAGASSPTALPTCDAFDAELVSTNATRFSEFDGAPQAGKSLGNSGEPADPLFVRRIQRGSFVRRTLLEGYGHRDDTAIEFRNGNVDCGVESSESAARDFPGAPRHSGRNRLDYRHAKRCQRTDVLARQCSFSGVHFACGERQCGNQDVRFAGDQA